MFDYKNATNKELHGEYKRIAAKAGDDQFFTKKELNFLPEVLMDNEELLAFSSGLMDNNTWLIALTNKRVIFLDKGLIYGLKQSSIPINKIQNVMGKTGIFFGDIAISDGSTTHLITNVIKHTVKPFTNMLQEQIEIAGSQISERENSTTSGKDDTIDKLEKLADLHEKGILTAEEFVAEKAKILGK